MKRLFLLILILIGVIQIKAKTISLIEYGGWFESAFVTWQPDVSAIRYNVYYSGEGVTDKKVDDPLVRSYGSYYRADVLGIKAGSYAIKVVPVYTTGEGTAAISGSINVDSHDRSGFAFANGRVPGAYNADGTPKSGAVVLYITNTNKNVVSLEVSGANSNPCVGLQAILDGFKKGKDTRPLIIRMVGQITDFSNMYNGDIVIENVNNAMGYITLEGVGDDAVADGWGIRIKNASNIEVRNIGSMNCDSDEGDNIGLQQNNDYVWVHHCDLFYGNAGSDADQIKGDGAMDCKKSTYVTFSYNHFWDSGKCNLLGLSEGSTSGLYVTYHHNWYDHSDSRHPRVRYYSAHVYNNYYDGNAKYGIGATMGSSVFAEANYFRNCRYPMLISMQGSDVYNETKEANDYKDMPTFSKEDGGIIKAFNNSINDARRFVPYGESDFPNSTVDFDAYVATTRDEQVNSIVKTYKGGNSYNNFDTNSSIMYGYFADTPDEAKEKVTRFAGRMNGGDFRWTFDNAKEDASYAVNYNLKAALTSYQTALVAVQGEDAIVTIPDDDEPKDTIPQDSIPQNPGSNPTEDIIHNFTLSGKTSPFFAISGNLSTTKGTVIYEGLTLTHCLKVESTTSISFTTTQAATLTLVLNETFTGKIKINNVDRVASAGIVTVPLSSGTHSITKTDVTNLFYMSLKYEGTPETPETPAPTITSTTPGERCDAGIVTLRATASAGTVNWYATATGGELLTTGNYFSTSILTETTTYYVDAVDNGKTTPSRTAVEAIIHTSPTILSVTSAARCDAGTVTLSASATVGTIYWYTIAAGGTPLQTGNNFTTPVISASTTYYVDADNNGCSTEGRIPVKATVIMTPTIMSTISAARTNVGSLTLGATASSGTIHWYTSALGGDLLGMGNSFTTPEIDSTTAFYAEATENGCTTSSRTAVLASITAAPVITSVLSAERCGEGTVTLGAASSFGAVSWYSQATGGEILGIGNSFTTPFINATTTYYVEAYDNGTTSSNRTAVMATINHVPSIQEIILGTRCDAGKVTLGATATTGTINWYATESGGTLIGSGVSFTTPVITSNATYYVEATDNGCTTASRSAITATVNVSPSIVSTTPAARCDAGTVTLGATATAGTVNWYATETGGALLGTGTSFTTPMFASTTTYYVEATDNGCATATRSAITATVNVSPSIVSATPAARCDAGTVTLGATATAGTINWYATETGGALLGTGTSFTTPMISSTTTYYVEATDNGCATATRSAITATVNVSPSIVSTTSAARCDAGTVTLGATATAGSVNWYATETGGALLGTGTSFTTPMIASTTTYYVEATDNGCATAARSAVTATVNVTPSIISTSPGTRNDAGSLTLGATGSNGMLQWFAQTTGGMPLGTGSSFTTPVISSTTTYYVEASDKGCTTITRIAVLATILLPADTTANVVVHTVGLNEVRFYPNPVNEVLTIQSESIIGRIEVYTLNGLLVMSAGAGTTHIDMSEIRTGTYHIRIFTEQGVYLRTIIKK